MFASFDSLDGINAFFKELLGFRDGLGFLLFFFSRPSVVNDVVLVPSRSVTL